METINKFKISKLAYTSGIITSSIIYFTLTHTGEFTAYLADNSIKITGIIGSNVVNILWGNIPYVISSTLTNKLAEFVKTNIKVGSEMSAISASVIAGFIAILFTVFLEFTYRQTKKYLLKNTKQHKYIEDNYINFSIVTVDDFEFITLK